MARLRKGYSEITRSRWGTSPDRISRVQNCMMTRRQWLAALAVTPLGGAEANLNEKDEGYRGIWYFNQPSNDQYVYKYSGGFATYPQQHAPIAIYSKAANKTFFCYGGTVKGKHELLHMVSYFDHATKTVPRPTILLNKKTEDAHDNPTLSIDDAGYIWIFSSAHGTSRPAYISRSVKPYSVDAFERVLETNFSYTQPWHLPGKGFLFLHTRYRPVAGGKTQGRSLFSMISKDGRQWSEPRQLAFAMMGHYQISWPDEARGRIGTAFDVHPNPVGLNARTNLHYMETRDLGATWQTVDGKPIELPILQPENAALVRDYRREGLLVYLKDLQYGPEGHPVLVYLTSKGYESGPSNSPRVITMARWTGKEWLYAEMGETDHNYDHGSLYLERDVWRYISPSGAGPQAWSTGGEIEVLESRDRGKSWKRTVELTKNSRFNHTYVRRPLHAHPDFYALWADGNALAPSDSSLYFANRSGSVYRLPSVMKGDHQKPERVW
jgi:hypothetical protein